MGFELVTEVVKRKWLRWLGQNDDGDGVKKNMCTR